MKKEWKQGQRSYKVKSRTEVSARDRSHPLSMAWGVAGVAADF